MNKPVDDDALIVEGLAGQLCGSDGGIFAWWHLANDAAKERWRKKARKQIADFNKHLAPWDRKP